ncbi:MAG: diguanylate cyclase [Candidatus Hydrogenedentes bacterium]|nr:diguanylate cyclase [Candidatus Hydrogenedentota bacterium]
MLENYASCRVLVADDEPLVAQVLATNIAKRLGCLVEMAGDGDQALRALALKPYDVLVTDMLMPGCHGIELVSRVVRDYPDTDILVTTAYPDDFPFVEVVKAGATDFVAKPHPPDELHAKLIRILRERSLREQIAKDKKRIEDDLNAMERLREERASAEIKYRDVFEYSTSGMLVISPEGNVIRDVNLAFCAIVRRSRDELLNRSFLELFDETEQDRLRQGIVVLGEIGKATLGDMVLRCEGGPVACLDVSLTRINVGPESIIHAICQDVTEQREMQRRLAEIAETDQLTGLFNKRSFSSRLDAAVAGARRDQYLLTVLFMDLDNFKQCNDRHGHQVGDALLNSVGQMILRHTRARLDSAFRYGGDEFAVLLTQADGTIGVRVAERIRADFQKLDTHGTSLSIGVAMYQEGLTSAELLKAADTALYKAKLAGKNQTCVA